MTTQEKKIAVNTAKDYTNFALHGLGYAGILAGVTLTVGSPVITGIAVATTLALKFGLGSYIKNAFSEALPEEEKELHHQFNRASGRAPALQTKLTSAFHKVKEFSQKLGLTETPAFHFLDEEDYATRLRRRLQDKGKGGAIREGLREFLMTEFNKYANAAAFSHDRDRVILTKPLAENLDEDEINAVTGHEVGHIAAKHSLKTGIMALMGSPARISAALYSLVVTFSSWKNVGLVVAGNFVGGMLSYGYGLARGLDTENNKRDKVEMARVRTVLQKLSKMGFGVAFMAPDLVIAQGISLATNETTKLLGKSYSRANEYQADRLAAEVTGKPMALITGLDKAREHNISFEKGMDMMPTDPDKKDSVLSSVFAKAKELYRTHPTNENRRMQMEKMALAMPQAAP